MKKSTKKSAKKKLDSKAQLLHMLDKSKAYLALHGVFFMFVLAGASIGYALYKGKTYLSPVRDEIKYQELSTSAYSKIDYNLVTKLSEALQDTDVKVTSDLDPGRNNPFSE